jgi:hypothetical protein
LFTTDGSGVISALVEIGKQRERERGGDGSYLRCHLSGINSNNTIKTLEGKVRAPATGSGTDVDCRHALLKVASQTGLLTSLGKLMRCSVY